MPYGVRVRMRGSGVESPFGVKIRVCRRTPSRIGIIAAVESRAGAAGACAVAAGTAGAATKSRRPRRPPWNGFMGRLSLSRPPGVLVGDRLQGVPDAPLAVLLDDPGQPGRGVPPGRSEERRGG